MYHLNGNSREEVPRDGSPGLVSDIAALYSESFSIRVTTEDEDRFEEFEEKIGGAMWDLIKEIEEEFEEPDIFEGEAELTLSVILPNEKKDGFLRALQVIADTAKELGADFECFGEFLPDEKPNERNNHGIEPFAALRIAGRDGKIEVSACRF